MLEKPAGEMPVTSENDAVSVRRAVRQAVIPLGFGVTDVTRIVTAASELTRNILKYAGSGSIRWRTIQNGARVGIELTFVDQGPGIPDIDQAMQEGFTTGRGLGLGLPGSKRLMDEMIVESAVGTGTTITVRKWLRRT